MALRSCSSSFTNDYEYDVFLSFRGEDTRQGFTGHLYKALDNRGIHTFIDDEKLKRGEQITPSLVYAIQHSRIAIIILSKHYASSSFCLHELATILDCLKGNEDRSVLPIFYKIDPSEVRHQKGSYEEAMDRHEERFKAEKEMLQKWRNALHQVANLSGYHFKDGDEYEYKFIEKIVEQVTSMINQTPLYVADYPVGLESQVPKVMKLLAAGCDDGVQMIGMHGMGGVGKSTLARAVYNNLVVENFNGWCFLKNVREESNKHGLPHLQRILLSKVVGEKNINLTCWEEGISKLKSRLKGKKVLLVLDDVDKPEQLQAIAGGYDWFGPGSKIIITTRDKQLLTLHEVTEIYEVEKLNNKDALQLLTWKAFKKEKADPSYEDILNLVVKYASGLPLALEVIGSSLFGKSVEEWESTIEQYKRIPKKEILEILKVSFHALEEEEKNVFLDIACCFNGYKLTEVEDILCAHYGHNIKPHISMLVEKSLMKLDYCRLTLHDLIEHMGKAIVRQESSEEPEERSRLWSWEDIIQVLEDSTGTSKIKIICLDFPIFSKMMVKWDGKAFKKMQKLRTLIIKSGNFSKGPKYLPNSLRVLEWWGYPSHCLPSDFKPRRLVICKLPKSNIKSYEFDVFPKASLKKMPLSLHGYGIVQFPSSISMMPEPELSTIEASHPKKRKRTQLEEDEENVDSIVSSNVYGRSVPDCNLNDDFFAGQLNIFHAPFQNICFPNLERIRVIRCDKLKKIFSVTTTSSLPMLKSLSIEGCKNLEAIISPYSAQHTTYEVSFPKLQIIEIETCNKLKTIFSSAIVICLPELATLNVVDCNELEEIFSFDSEEGGEVEQISKPAQQVFLPKIYYIIIKECNKLKCIFPYSVACQCSSLHFLIIESCSQLEQIVKVEHKATSEEGEEMAVDDNRVCLLSLQVRKGYDGVAIGLVSEALLLPDQFLLIQLLFV
ncbi:hypothetical protein VNO78_27537 [Psophocarpus tetragonolobus]|uniref:TIR domain-containing protein n=1 Tax=Psophocarpus tetragonolobus TaxID=3891 RepID=A0AAN9S182_PSOTE